MIADIVAAVLWLTMQAACLAIVVWQYRLALGW